MFSFFCAAKSTVANSGAGRRLLYYYIETDRTTIRSGSFENIKGRTPRL